MEREGSRPTGMVHEELLIRDIRAGVTPAQMVESKLALLGESRMEPQGRMRTAALARPS